MKMRLEPRLQVLGLAHVSQVEEAHLQHTRKLCVASAFRQSWRSITAGLRVSNVLRCALCQATTCTTAVAYMPAQVEYRAPCKPTATHISELMLTRIRVFRAALARALMRGALV